MIGDHNQTSSAGWTTYNPDDFRWKGMYVQFSDSAKLHLHEYKLNVYEVIDMLNDPVPCPKSVRFRKTDIEVCSKKNKMTFRITLFEDYCWDVKQNCWCIKHVKPT